MKDHELKCLDRFFGAIFDGSKPFEVRFNDRDYQVDDMLLLVEVRRKSTECGVVYPVQTGRCVQRRVTYVLKHDDFPEGVPDGWCVLGLSDRSVTP
jgi:hypothetical protein